VCALHAPPVAPHEATKKRAITPLRNCCKTRAPEHKTENWMLIRLRRQHVLTARAPTVEKVLTSIPLPIPQA
jgi:hypothetical protein